MIIYFVTTQCGNPQKIDKKRFLRAAAIGQTVCKVKLWLNGVHFEERRADFDYSKWLGPGYEAPAHMNTIVSNHCGLFESLFYISRYFPMFIAKAEVQKWPIFGMIVSAMKAIFVER